MSNIQTATLAGGCFWCIEAVFDQLQGVTDVVSGYAGGHTENPTYKEVCSETTGHAEAVQVKFDADVTSYADITRVLFTVHDPTQLNRQGNDVGESYRSAIFFHSPEQEKTAREVIAEIESEGLYPGKVVTEVTAFTNFYPAEDYHQEYFAQNPYQGYCMAIVAPKVRKFRQKYTDRLKK